MKDLKEALGTGIKPDVTHVRKATMVYVARACEYGSEKYERANYLRPVDDMRAAFGRYREYLRSVVGHVVDTLDAMERHQALDPELEDVEGMRRAAYAADTSAGQSFPASGLPHVSHGAAGLNMAITQAVDSGLLPEDPGQPWRFENTVYRLVDQIRAVCGHAEPTPSEESGGYSQEHPPTAHDPIPRVSDNLQLLHAEPTPPEENAEANRPDDEQRRTP